MHTCKRCLCFTAVLLSTILAVLQFPIGTAKASMVTTEQALHPKATTGARAKVRAFLDRDDVRARIVALGVNPEEAKARVDALSDAEVERVAGRIDALPAGQSAVGVLVGAILIIFLVLLLTDLFGLTDVFPFVRKHPAPAYR